MKATWNGDGDRAERRHRGRGRQPLLPRRSLKREYVTFSNHHTSCPWKGEASYYSLLVNGEMNPDAVWYYADPKPEAEMVGTAWRSGRA